MAPPLSWSAPPPSIVSRLVAGDPITFWVTESRLVGGDRHVHFVFVPLSSLDVLGGGPGAIGRVLPAATRDSWLVWQDVSRVGAVSTLPVEASALVAEWSLPSRNGRSKLATEAIGEIMEAMYAYRAV